MSSSGETRSERGACFTVYKTARLEVKLRVPTDMCVQSPKIVLKRDSMFSLLFFLSFVLPRDKENKGRDNIKKPLEAGKQTEEW